MFAFAAVFSLMVCLVSCGHTPTPVVSQDDGNGSISHASGQIFTSENFSAADTDAFVSPLFPSGSSGTVSGDPSNEPTPTPQENRLNFLAAGDNIIHEAVYTDAMALAAAQTALNGYAEKYYFDSMYNGVSALIKNADMAFVNHECPVAGEKYGISGYPRFNSPFESLEALARLGFDVVNVANNHMLDMDASCTGLKNTVENASKTGMLVIGGYTKEDYDDLRIVEKNGVRVAFLSYTACMNYTTVNPASTMIVPYAEDSTIRRQTALARANADFVIVSMHWGTENSFSVDGEQQRLAKLLNECGVDVILGHHSHTIQKVEWIGEGEHRTLCYYSLGNFLSTQHPIKNLTGIFASFDFVIDSKGERHVENACAIPHMTWYSTSRDRLQLYLLADVTEDLVKTHGSQLRTVENGGTFTLADIKKYAEQQLGSFLYYGK